MIIDIDSYSASKKIVINWLSGRKIEDVSEAIAKVSVFTYVPVIVVAFYFGEQIGWSEEIKTTILRLKDFYGYTEIRNIPKDCPFSF